MIILTGASGYIGSFFRKENNKKILCYSLKRRKNSVKIDDYINLPKAKIIIYLSDLSDIDEYSKLDTIKLKNMIKKTKLILDKNKFKKVIYISSNVLLKKKNRRNTNYIFYKKTIEKFVLKNRGIVFRISTIVGNPIKKNTLMYKIINDKQKMKYINKTFEKELLHIKDFIRLIKLASTKTNTFGIFGVTSEKPFLVRDLYSYFNNDINKNNLNLDNKLKNNKHIKKTRNIFKWKPIYNGKLLLDNI